MSSPDFNEYRDQILRLRDLTEQARTVAKEMVVEGYNAKNVRASLYEAGRRLDAAAQHVQQDLLGQSSTDRQYERDLS